MAHKKGAGKGEYTKVEREWAHLKAKRSRQGFAWPKKDARKSGKENLRANYWKLKLDEIGKPGKGSCLTQFVLSRVQA